MANKKLNNIDAIVIGGGFYGSVLALNLKKKYNKVVLVEKNTQLLQEASYNNQARIHNGYHYPRSFITALSSHQNYLKFSNDFKNAVYDNFDSYYAIAAHNSKVSSDQFISFCKKIQSPIKTAPSKIKELFNPVLVDNVFSVEEYVFNSAKLRQILEKKLHQADIEVLFNFEAVSVTAGKSSAILLNNSVGTTLKANRVFNCTYAGINNLLQNSNLPLLPLKFETTEMPLVSLPLPFKNLSITVMDGPFFSLMPFPDKKMHTIHHVRYTPHSNWTGITTQTKNPDSNFVYMLKDIQRYLPSLKKVVYNDSIFQTKTILTTNESNDGRPILLRNDYFLKNFHIILGGKIDNIYDVLKKLDAQGL